MTKQRSATSGELMRTWQYAGFELRLFDLHEDIDHAHWRVGYQLLDNGVLIFDEVDLGVPKCHAIDSWHTVESALGWASLRPGDTDREFFASYTSEQRDWRDSGRAEELSCLCMEVREMGQALDGREHGWCDQAQIDEEHDPLSCVPCREIFGNQARGAATSAIVLEDDGEPD